MIVKSQNNLGSSLPTTGNLPKFDSEGNLIDSGIPATNASIIDGEVDTYSDLPSAAAHNGETYYVKNYSILTPTKLSGLYLSNGTTWDRRSDKVLYSLTSFPATTRIIVSNDTDRQTVASGVSIDGSNNITGAAGLNLSGLTASQAVVTDASKNLISLAYASTNTASSLVQRDGSGNFAAGGVTVTSLTNSGLTAGRVTFAGTAGILSDAALFTFDSATLRFCSGIGSLGYAANVGSLTNDQDGIAVRAVRNPEMRLYKGATDRGFLGIAGNANDYYTGTTANSTVLSATAGDLFIASGNLITAKFDTSQNLVLTNPLLPPSGGTGLISYGIGDMLYADSSSTLAKLPSVATGNAIISGGIGIAPSWGKIGISTHVSGLGTGVATFLGTPSSANLLAAVTDETGTGALVFGTSPVFTTKINVNATTNKNLWTEDAASAFTSASGMVLRSMTDAQAGYAPLYVVGSEVYFGTGTNASKMKLTSSGTLYITSGGTQDLIVGGTGASDYTLLLGKNAGNFHQINAYHQGSGGVTLALQNISGANLSFFTGTDATGTGNIFIGNAAAVPGSSPAGGGTLYVESGALKFRGSSGTVTTIANA